MHAMTKGACRSRYLARFGDEAHTAPAYEHNAEFSRVLEDRMAFYSTDQRADTINRVRGEISEVKTVMIENIDKVRRPHPITCNPLLCNYHMTWDNLRHEILRLWRLEAVLKSCRNKCCALCVWSTAPCKKGRHAWLHALKSCRRRTRDMTSLLCTDRRCKLWLSVHRCWTEGSG